MRRAVVLAFAGLGVAVGAYSLGVAHDAPASSFAGRSTGGAFALLGGGLALIACGLVCSLRLAANRVGPLLAGAGVAWFLLEWNNPGVGSALAFTVGLCLYAACPPLVDRAASRPRISRRHRGSMCQWTAADCDPSPDTRSAITIKSA